MTTDPLTLAYLAGVIDSDGYITITRASRKGKLYFAASVGITGTRRQPHDLAASVWGGNVYQHVPKNPRHRTQFVWCRQGETAAGIITDVLPFLRVKEDHAWLALECQELVVLGRLEDPYPWYGPNYDPTAELEEMRDEMITVLNQDRRAGPDGRRPPKVKS